MKLITMTTDEWMKEFRPVANHIEKNSPWENENGEGTMFETYGEELDFVKKTNNENPFRVWTIMDCDESDDLIICEGFHFVNRMGYFITEKNFDKENNYSIIDK